MEKDPNVVIEKELFQKVTVIANDYGKPQCATVIAGMIRDFKRVYKYFDSPEPIIEIKKALIEYIKNIDLEVGK